MFDHVCVSLSMCECVCVCGVGGVGVGGWGRVCGWVCMHVGVHVHVCELLLSVLI